MSVHRFEAPCTVVVSDDLATALAADPAVRAAFDAMFYTYRKEWVAAVDDAGRPETRARRIAQAVAAARARIA